ncbi:hypothetical protein A6A19_00695 [Actinobacillus delphinicola]|uniref:MMPL family transporter n=1 Tax=Actinobacillus delphinicola TaxID=51161 RepID=UPI0024416AE0|nr:hypothetical protein [Actinobacillus delphinicola]MDG6896549.1 hypothetical protein [Actinobacillus delphinicola]
MSMRIVRTGFLLLVLAMTALLGIALQKGTAVETDLQTLLPKEQHLTALQRKVDAIQERQFAEQMIVLIGNKNKQQAENAAQQAAEFLGNTYLFAPINLKQQPNLDTLKAEINQLKIATLPQSVQRTILSEPQSYFQKLAQQIVNPFNQQNLLSFAQDSFGFGRFVLPQLQGDSPIQWDSQSGMLWTKYQQTYWVLLPLRLKNTDFLQDNSQFLAQIQQLKSQVTATGNQILMTGSALFSSYAKQQAQKEMTVMSILGISLTLALLLFVFRTWRVFYLFIPIGIGLICGMTSVILYFGQIHALTIVIGTSLVGVLIDFPLHWLVSACGKAQTASPIVMKQLQKTFFISLLVTLIGYGLLAFTHLPILQQTALFSATALICVMLATWLFMPILFKGYKLQKIFRFSGRVHFKVPKKVKTMGGYAFIIFVVVGIFRSQWHDDIRQWVNLPKALLQQSMAIRDITKIDLSQQYFLVQADNPQALLRKDQQVSVWLQTQQKRGAIGHFQSLGEWLNTAEQQREFIHKFQQLPPSVYAPLVEIGIPAEYLQKQAQSLSQTPILDLENALKLPLAQAKQRLYLGEVLPKIYVSIIPVSGATNSALMQHFAQKIVGVTWQDKRQALNQTFQQTRDQALGLKLLSFLLAALLLFKFFGVRDTAKILSIPFAAIIITIGLLGWLAIPISLFSLFGLLLVSAIGIDYAAYVFSVPDKTTGRYFTIQLAATTTLISFVLLGLSSTPAVADFGFSVSIGTIVSVILTFLVHK